MGYTIGQAAKATGKSKSTISKAIKKGRISATQNEIGNYNIDPSELHRIYPPVSNDETLQPVSKATQANTDLLIEISQLKATLEITNQRIVDKEDVIDDLRIRLNEEATERRKLTSLITDQRNKEDLEKKRNRGFFRWLTTNNS